MKMKKKALLAALLALVLVTLLGAGAFAAGTDGEAVSPETKSSEETTETSTESEEPTGTEETKEPGTPNDGGSGEAEEAKTVKLSFYDYDGTLLKADVEHKAGEAIAAESVPASLCQKDAPVVKCWIMVCGTETKDVTDVSAEKPTADAAFYAAWQVSYLDTDGETLLGTEFVKPEAAPQKAPDKTKSGAAIAGWIGGEKSLVTLAEEKIGGDVSYTAWVRPSLNTSGSVAYVNGYTDKEGHVYQFAPTRGLTRAEAATMLYKLLDEGSKKTGPFEVSFTDVGTKWYATAINTLASNGILSGVGDGLFKPDDPITRAQFVLMVSRLIDVQPTEKTGVFTDVSAKTTGNSWYYDAVVNAYEKGWISGYPDGSGFSFRPQKKITRAEAVRILNQVLGRTVDKSKIDGLGVRLFIDVDDSSYWAFYDIMDAATGGGANLPKTGLTQGRTKIGGSYYYVNENGQFLCMTSGLQKMPDGKYYYFTKTGAAAPVYGEGLRILSDSKLYLLSADGSIVHEPRSGYDTRVYEYGNRMYYIQNDGSLLRNGYFGPLYFGQNGAYTSGDSTLDAWTFDFLKDVLSSSKSQEDKLYDAYIRLRDWPLKKWGNGAMGYYRYPNIGSHTYQELAALFFKNARGTCEEWSSAMVYLAQRIGYKAEIAEGRLKTTYNNPYCAVHAWEVIEIKGKKYTFDVEQEWGYMYCHYASYKIYYDCWKMEYAPSKNIYYGNRFGNAVRNVWSPYYYYYGVSF